MGRRKKHETVIAGGAAVLFVLVALCCGGPIALINSLTAPRSEVAPRRTQLTPQQILRSEVVPSVQPEPSFQYRPSQVVDSPAVAVAEEPPALPLADPAATSVESAPAIVPEPKPEIFRKWTDDTGTFTVVAVAARWDSNEAKLQREDGKLLTLPLAKLSATDREYLHATKFPPTYLPGGKVALGKAVGVTDGDTIKLLDDDKGNYTFRLEGIDAPESHQAFGTQAKKALSDKVFGKVVRVEWKEQDKYGRTLGHVYFGNRNINLELVDEGMAWHYKKYSSDQQLAAAEQHARDRKIGLWSATNRIPPWEFRKGTEEKAVVAIPAPIPFAPTPQPIDQNSITVYVTKTGNHYHRSGCRSLSKSQIPISIDRARAGYSRCSVCNPP